MKEDIGRIIDVTSMKGGVGKTTITLCLAGIYSLMNKRVLVIDFDLYSGGIAASLDINNTKDVFMMIDSISNNRFTELSDYITHYNNGIDILAAPKDPRQASRVNPKYIPLVFEVAKKEYDVILVDTNHASIDINVYIKDYSDMDLFIISNDLVDLKNMRSMMNIFKDVNKTNYLVLLNNSRDTGKDYMSIYDIKNIIQTNIDYTISKNFYIKNIDKYILKGEILTLNKNINIFHGGDIVNMKKLANRLLEKEKTATIFEKKVDDQNG